MCSLVNTKHFHMYSVYWAVNKMYGSLKKNILDVGWILANKVDDCILERIGMLLPIVLMYLNFKKPQNDVEMF